MNQNLFYNTQHQKILFKEYGRSVQEMVAYSLTIADRQKRSRVAQSIVSLMSELLPAQNKNTDEFQHKLWDHLHIIANFELDIDSPFPKPNPEDLHHPIKSLVYPHLNIRHKHYGKHLEILVQRAIEMPDGDKKTAMVRIIAHYMKIVHKNLRNEIVSDESIRKDLKNLSKGALDIVFTEHNGFVLEADPPKPSHKRKRSRSKLNQTEHRHHNTDNGNNNNRQNQSSNSNDSHNPNRQQKSSDQPLRRHTRDSQQQSPRSKNLSGSNITHNPPHNNQPPANNNPPPIVQPENSGSSAKRKRHRNRKKKS